MLVYICAALVGTILICLAPFLMILFRELYIAKMYLAMLMYAFYMSLVYGLGLFGIWGLLV